MEPAIEPRALTDGRGRGQPAAAAAGTVAHAAARLERAARPVALEGRLGQLVARVARRARGSRSTRSPTPTVAETASPTLSVGVTLSRYLTRARPLALTQALLEEQHEQLVARGFIQPDRFHDNIFRQPPR